MPSTNATAISPGRTAELRRPDDPERGDERGRSGLMPRRPQSATARSRPTPPSFHSYDEAETFLAAENR